MDWLKHNFLYLLQAPDNDTNSHGGGTSHTFSETLAEEIKAANTQKMEKSRKVRQEVDKKAEDQLIVIHGAQIKFNTHLGEFNVLSDVPTTQDRQTGTVVEKQAANFSFYDGFRLLSLTEWQDFGTIQVQDNHVLLQKSFLPAVGKMPGNVPPESGNLQFVNSAQANVPDQINTAGAPVPAAKDNTEYIYYTKEGLYLGGVESSAKVYITTETKYHKAKTEKKWNLINVESNLLQEKSKNIPNNKFVEKASTIYGESSAYHHKVGIEEELRLEMCAIASVHKINKIAYGINSEQAKLFRKTNIFKRNETKMQLAVAALITSLTTNEDASNGATMWDGAEQAGFSKDDDRFSSGKFEIHMNTMGWTISEAHYAKWKKGVERLSVAFKAPREKYTPGKNPKNKYSTAQTIALESRAVYLGTIFWKELKNRKKKPDAKK